MAPPVGIAAHVGFVSCGLLVGVHIQLTRARPTCVGIDANYLASATLCFVGQPFLGPVHDAQQ